MKLKNHSENCLICKCRNCNHTYVYNKKYYACFNYCDDKCKGLEIPTGWEASGDNECFYQLKEVDIDECEVLGGEKDCSNCTCNSCSVR